MRRVLEMTFAGEAADVVTCDGGEAALDKALEFGPDVVFADASMPGVDGYTLAQRLKGHPSLNKAAVIVMASQHTPYDDGKGRKAGVDDHISKPFDTQSVIDRVAQVLARPRAMPAGAAEPPKPPAPVAAPPIPTAPARPMAAAPGARSPAHATRLGLGNPAISLPTPAKPAPIVPSAPARPAPAPPVAAPMAAANAARKVASPAAAIDTASQAMGGRLEALGLSREQVEAVLALSREIVEQVVWEVVPDLAEQLIKEEIKRLTAD